MALSLEQLTLAIIVGTLAAIVYALRVLVILERRIARMDGNIMKPTTTSVMSERIWRQIPRNMPWNSA